MNTRLLEQQDRQRRRFEADFAARLEVLFRNCPALAGFTVPENLPVGHDVAASVNPSLPANITCYVEDLGQAEAILAEVASMLTDVVEESGAEVLDLLQGRTFARTVH